MLALVAALLAIGGVVYLVGHPLNNPDHYPSCLRYQYSNLLIFHFCRTASLLAWQVAVAVLLGLAALGLAVIAGRPRRPPEGLSKSRLARVWR